ncbi:MAG: hypothetical protein ACLTGI_12665 [Hoylesella buccalis]
MRDGAKVMKREQEPFRPTSGSTSCTATAFYAQNNIGLFHKYYVDLGARVDYNTAFGDNVEVAVLSQARPVLRDE